MKRTQAALVWALLLAVSAGYAAKTPQQLKSELQGLIPTGKKARLAWLKGGFQRGDWDGTGASLPGARDHSLYVMDSDEGIVRELTPTSMFPAGKRNIDNPSITHDGSRVVFSETYTDTKYVINWNGTGLKSLAAQGYLSRYWRDPVNNTDWMTIESGGIYRVNIDNPSERVLLWNKSGYSRPWYSLSRDGTRMAFNCPHPKVGIATVPNGALTTLPGEGCFVNISPDNNYQVIPQNGNHTIHTIYTSSGSVVKSVNTSATILAGFPNPTKVTLNGCKNDESEYECTRWVHSDYLTFFFYATNVNPFIECISTGKWMYIHDAAELGDCGWAGNLDMVILNPTAVIPGRRFAPPGGNLDPGRNREFYSLNGQRIDAAGPGIRDANRPGLRGVVVSRVLGAKTAELKAVGVD